MKGKKTKQLQTRKLKAVSAKKKAKIITFKRDEAPLLVETRNPNLASESRESLESIRARIEKTSVLTVEDFGDSRLRSAAELFDQCMSGVKWLFAYGGVSEYELSGIVKQRFNSDESRSAIIALKEIACEATRALERLYSKIGEGESFVREQVERTVKKSDVWPILVPWPNRIQGTLSASLEAIGVGSDLGAMSLFSPDKVFKKRMTQPRLFVKHLGETIELLQRYGKYIVSDSFRYKARTERGSKMRYVERKEIAEVLKLPAFERAIKQISHSKMDDYIRQHGLPESGPRVNKLIMNFLQLLQQTMCNLVKETVGECDVTPDQLIAEFAIECAGLPELRPGAAAEKWFQMSKKILKRITGDHPERFPRLRVLGANQEDAYVKKYLRGFCKLGGEPSEKDIRDYKATHSVKKTDEANIQYAIFRPIEEAFRSIAKIATSRENKKFKK